ncbi:DUF4365 domain-containing protein [Nonomuraea fuscirosea]|uniref:DUF4365 domain-containing protein n=1 Tax=Nonomuraea fuscirosea TaxID=1291556 RepID=UPI0033C61092
MHNSRGKSRQREVDAVNKTRTFLEHNGLIYQDIDLRNDIGKDAILDLAADGSDAGLSVALQIKGGRKYKQKAGRVIPINARLRRVWRNSSMPVYVIVHDPDDGELYWGDLMTMAQNVSDTAKSVRVQPDDRLTPDGLEDFLDAVRLACAKKRPDPILNLVSKERELQQSALFDCLMAGRSDPRYLMCVRRLLLCFEDQGTLYSAIHLLAHATAHPDIFWHKGNHISEEVSKEIRSSYRWTPNEIAQLLARMPEEGIWSRGTIGQSLYMILAPDPSLEWMLDRVILESYRADASTWKSTWIKAYPFGPKWVRESREAVIYPCLTLALYMADDARERFDEFMERMPRIEGLSMFHEIREIIDEFGFLDIF